MTVIGKILTLLNFFLALVFLGFAFTVNMTNKDPQSKKTFPEALREEREARAAAQKTIDELRRQITTLKSDDASHASEKQAIINQYQAQIDDLQKKYNVALAAKDSAVAQFEQKQTEAAALAAQLDIRRKEIEAKDTTIRDRERTIAEQITQIAKITNERIQARVQADSLAERLQKIEAEFKQLTILYENLQEGIIVRPGVDGGIIAPPDDVQGTVVKVVENGRLMSINIGSDHGLRRGHELFVYRTEPKPEYLGKIRIEEVGPHEAVGKLLPPNLNKKIKEKDIVASKIIGR